MKKLRSWTNVLVLVVLATLLVAVVMEFQMSTSVWGDASRDSLPFLPPPHQQTTTTAINSTAIESTTATINSTTTESANHKKRSKYPENDGNTIGVLSTKDPSFFQALRDKIDAQDEQERCKRYNFKYHPNVTRRIFWGALIASEPWELFEIVATEAFGVYAGLVLVEANRTQNFSPRNVTRMHHASTMHNLFFAPNDTRKRVDMRLFIDENPKLLHLNREHAQRQEILQGWKNLGMQPDDIGILSDPDEVMSRDFLRALQTCQIPELDYSKHGCRPDQMGIRSATQVYESSPECIMFERTWFQPNAFVGHCIEQIGDKQRHPPAPRDRFYRRPGWSRTDWNVTTDHVPPLLNGADFRRMGGQKWMGLAMSKKFQNYTGFHFHNFFASVDAIRFKYQTFGHADRKAHTKRMDELSADLGMAVRCARGVPDSVNAMEKRVEGGFDALLPFRPIYFHDEIYRQKRHKMIQEMVYQEDLYWKKLQSISDSNNSGSSSSSISNIISNNINNINNSNLQRSL